MAEVASASRQLETVGRDVDELKAQIYERINKHFTEYISSFDIEGADDIDALRAQVEQIKTAIEEDNFDEVAKISEEASRARSQVQVTDSLIDTVETLSQIDKDLLAHDAFLEAGNLVDAASMLMRVHELLDDSRLQQKEYCDAKILTILRRDFREKRAHLRSRIEDLWRRSVVWQQHTIGSQHAASVQVTTSLEVSEAHVEMDISEVIATLNAMGLLDSQLNHFSTQLMDRLLIPLCTNHTLEPTVQQTNHTHILTLDDKLPSIKTRKLRSKARAVQEALGVFTSLRTVLQFLFSHVFGDDTELIAQLGNTLYQPLTEAVIAHLLAKAVALHVSNDELHEQVMNAVGELENYLHEVGLAPEGDAVLTTYVQNVGLHDHNRRRQEILARARALMMADNFNTIQVEHATERGGLFPATEQVFDTDTAELRESIYKLPTCHITETTKKVMDLIYTTLDESARAEPPIAVQLFFTVRDVLALFHAIVPTVHAKALEAAPQLAVTLYNDCIYIAHHLLSLGYVYRGSLPEELQPVATFVDLVPMFRDLGHAQLEAMMKKQLENIESTLDMCQGFGETGNPGRFDTVDRAIKQTLHQLAVFTKISRGVMQPAVFDACLGSLISIVVNRVVAEILHLQDISEEETTHLGHFISLLLEQLRATWNREMSEEALLDQVPTWERLVQLQEILAERLVVIKEKFDAGYWVFSATELRGLIKAIFADSARRQDILRSIH
eukprot:m.10817 g.10817  ORF g.10817 m.10817 type:complete len:728 (-) comp6241_c1_seq1:508-2691(-)